MVNKCGIEALGVKPRIDTASQSSEKQQFRRSTVDPQRLGASFLQLAWAMICTERRGIQGRGSAGTKKLGAE